SVPAVPGVIFSTPAAGGGQFNDGGNTAAVTATQFLIPLFYQSSAGGAENFIYAGEAGNDSLVYNTPANGGAGSNLVYTPSAKPDAGTITGTMSGGAALTPLTFSGLGTANPITFTTANSGRTDHLTVKDESAAIGDVFTVTPANGGSVTVARPGPNGAA